jgi:hypothetical protein
LNGKITGIIKDDLGKPLSYLFVEAYDSDFGTSEDYLGNATTDAQGKFEISFDERAFKQDFEILERRPDIYIKVSDSYRTLYTSQVRSEAADSELYFDIIIRELLEFQDPYANSFQRIIATVNAIGDTIDISQVNPQRSITQMVRALGNWSYYTTPKIMEAYGYPGPQVPRYPKRVKHGHSLPWNKMDSENRESRIHTNLTQGT